MSLEEMLAMEAHESHMERLDAAADALEQQLDAELPKCEHGHDPEIFVICRDCGEITAVNDRDWTLS